MGKCGQGFVFAVESLDGKILPAKNVVKLCSLETILKYGGPTTEIHCSDSTVLNADPVIVATVGTWTTKSESSNLRSNRRGVKKTVLTSCGREGAALLAKTKIHFETCWVLENYNQG